MDVVTNYIVAKLSKLYPTVTGIITQSQVVSNPKYRNDFLFEKFLASQFLVLFNDIL